MTAGGRWCASRRTRRTLPRLPRSRWWPPGARAAMPPDDQLNGPVGPLWSLRASVMAAEPVVSAYVDGRRRMWRGSSCGPALIQCSVRAMRVEVLDVLAQTMSRWRGPVIKEVVEAFPAQGADDPFCNRLARGRPDRGAMIQMSAPVNTASKVAVNLLSRSRIKNRNWSAVDEFHRGIAGLLGHPGAARVGGDPGDVRAAAVLDHDKKVEAAQEHTVDVGEVDSKDHLGLRGQELSPGRTGLSERWIESDRPVGALVESGVLADLQTAEAATVGRGWPARPRRPRHRP